MPSVFFFSSFRLRLLLPGVCSLTVAAAGVVHGGEPPRTEAGLAMSVLRKECASCHSPEKQKGGLVLTTREALLQGGDSGAAVVPVKPEESLLIRSLAAAAESHMPPKKQLSAAQVRVLEAWVRAGLPWDAAAMAGEGEPRAVALQALPPGQSAVLALALSPDGKRLAAGCGSEVVLCAVQDGGLQVVARAAAHLDAVQSLTWSADGRHLITGAFRRMAVWETEPLRQVREITSGLTGRITALRTLPEAGAVLAADDRAGERGELRVFDFLNGRQLRHWQAHEDTVFALALTKDGRTAASGGGDRMVKLWNVADGTESARLEAHDTQVLSVAFSPDGTQLVSGGADRQFKVWDVQTRQNTTLLPQRGGAVNAACWSAAEPGIVGATDEGSAAGYTELKAHTGAQSSEAARVKQLCGAGSPLYALAEADGRIFAGTADGRILHWDKDGKALEALTLLPQVEPAAEAKSFVNDVLPVLAKAGCAGGSCHAKAAGQSGFKLSVFSYDPAGDYHGIVHGARGRRVFPAAAEESLLLLKAAQILPHEGGERIAPGSEAWHTLREWIRGGMVYQRPGEPVLTKLEVSPAEISGRREGSQQITAKAVFSDGSSRDVTALSEFSSSEKQVATVDEHGVVSLSGSSGQSVVVVRYMGLVEGARITVPADRLQPEEAYEALPVHNFIDTNAYARFRQLGLLPSGLCSDTEFLRRATLDTIGLLPTADEAREFLADPRPDKRARAVDRLLEHPARADHWAAKWADLLRPNPDRVGVKSVYVLDQWLRDAFRRNQPYDAFVREILLTQGNTHRSGPAVIYRDRREPAELTTMFSQIFLGVRMDCAKCHHHPNEKWSQEDFYRFAAFFAPLQQKGGGISAPISGGNETFFVTAGRTQKHPVTGAVMHPQPLDGAPAALEGVKDPRQALADWMLAPENPFFAKAVVNRVWAQFFSRGIVDPVDDFRLSNPPANPALLDALAQEFVRGKYDLKALMRTILNSRLYQLSSEPNETNAADARNFSRFYRRRFGAEAMADALAAVTGVRDDFPGLPPGGRATQAWTYKIDSLTMDAFGRPNSSSDCPCERDARPAIAQALHLMNAAGLQSRLASTSPQATVQRLTAGGAAPDRIVEELYLLCYARLPDEAEKQAALAAFPAAADAAALRTATEDVFWALINSAEFVFNH